MTILGIICIALALACGWLIVKLIRLRRIEAKLRQLLSEDGRRSADKWREVAMYHVKQKKDYPRMADENRELQYHFALFAVAAMGNDNPPWDGGPKIEELVEPLSVDQLRQRLPKPVTYGKMLAWIREHRKP